MVTTEPPATPVPGAEHPSTPNGQVSDVPDIPTVTGPSATDAFLEGLDQLVVRLAIDAVDQRFARVISHDELHGLLTNYAQLQRQIRSRRRDLKK